MRLIVLRGARGQSGECPGTFVFEFNGLKRIEAWGEEHELTSTCMTGVIHARDAAGYSFWKLWISFRPSKKVMRS